MAAAINRDAMHTLIVLPGNSPRNKAWGDGAAEYFGGMFDDVYVQYYDHWESGDEFIDLDRESEKLKERVANDGADVNLYIFAKSIGTILTLVAVHRSLVAPQKCVFFGMPLNIVAEQDTFKGDWSPLRSFDVPTITFQNDNDPTADHDFAVQKLEKLKPAITVVTMQGDTHDYTEFESYEHRIKEFLSL